MDHKILVFSGIYLSMNDKALDLSEFKSRIPAGPYQIVSEKKVHIFQIYYINNYLKIDFSDGSAMPRNPVVHTLSGTQAIEVPNPRQDDQVETKESFGLIDFDTCCLWLSNSKKRGILLEFLKIHFGNVKFTIKDIYDQEKFIQTLQTLDQIKIAAVPNIFSQTATLSEGLANDINQYGAVEAILHLKFQQKWIGEGLEEKIRSIFNNRSNYNGIVIAGRDEKNLGMLFNSFGFSRKIEIKATIDENEMFNSEDVFNKLITKIDDEKS